MMRTAKCRWVPGLVLLVSCAAAAGAPPRALPDVMPEGTLLYIGWPGIDTLAKTTGDTELSKLLNEPAVLRFRQQWGEKAWPAINERLAEEIGDDEEVRIYESVRDVLSSMWQYPVAIGLTGVDMTEEGPQIDAAIIVRAGQDAPKLAEALERLAAMTPIPMDTATETRVGEATLKELAMPAPVGPIRWGVVGDDFVIFVGQKMLDRLSATDATKGLGRSERFAAAMKITGGSPDDPTFFLDLRGIIQALEKSQPMFADLGLPVLGEEGGVQKLLEDLGVGSLQSLSAVMVPEAGGFRTSMLVHAPGIDERAAALLGKEPVADADLAVVPEDASWGSVSQFDLLGFYQGLLEAVQMVAPPAYPMVMGGIAEVERELGLKIEDDLLGAFGDTWIVFDAPSNGGIWFSGITLVVDVKPGNRLDGSLEKIVSIIAREVRHDAEVSTRTEEYRGQSIRFVNVAGVPMPIAPAWAEYNGRFILALYPQMVRVTLDRLIDKGESILDNPDFQRGRKLMPPRPYAINYVDTKRGVEQLYPWVLPLGQMLMAMGQAEGIPLDVSMLPSARTVSKHMFGNVSASAMTKDGFLTVSHGPLPIAVPAVGEGMMILPLLGAWFAGSRMMTIIEMREAAMSDEEDMTLEEFAAAHPEFAARKPGSHPLAVQRSVKPGGAVSSQIELFRMHMGRYPGELKELVEEPEKEEDAEKWQGPYLQDLADPWGNDFRYKYPGEHNKDGYDLWSLGLDGEDGTGDEPTNWSQQ